MTTYAIPNGRTVMDATLYTGTNAAANITNTTGFKPDLVWIKDRSNAYTHVLVNSVAGANKDLYSNQNAGQETSTAGTGVTAFNSNGFALGTNISGTSYGATNINNDTFVAWQWQAGQGTTSSNTNGSITSTVSANVTAGFSVVQYACNHTSGATVGHGLGAVPQFMLVKLVSGAANWKVYHASLGNTQHLELNTTSGAITDTNTWNNTTPTSTVFTIGNSNELNPVGGTAIAFCWTPIAGYSAFGSYTGNGSADGPFIYLGFKPAYILLKRTDSTADWLVEDNKRLGYNVDNNDLVPNTDAAEATDDRLDFLSNGFKLRSTFTSTNANGGTYVYAAFAENPFKYVTAR